MEQSDANGRWGDLSDEAQRQREVGWTPPTAAEAAASDAAHLAFLQASSEERAAARAAARATQEETQAAVAEAKARYAPPPVVVERLSLANTERIADCIAQHLAEGYELSAQSERRSYWTGGGVMTLTFIKPPKK